MKKRKNQKNEKNEKKQKNFLIELPLRKKKLTDVSVFSVMKPNRYNLTVTTNRYNQPLHMDSKLGFVVAALSEKFDFDYEDAMKFLSKPLKKSKKKQGRSSRGRCQESIIRINAIARYPCSDIWRRRKRRR